MSQKREDMANRLGLYLSDVPSWQAISKQGPQHHKTHQHLAPSPCAQATDAATYKFVVKVPMGASPGEVIGVVKVNGKPYGSVTVPPGAKPGKRLKMQVPHPPGSKVSFDYAGAYVPPGEGSRVSPAAPVRCAA